MLMPYTIQYCAWQYCVKAKARWACENQRRGKVVYWSVKPVEDRVKEVDTVNLSAEQGIAMPVLFVCCRP